MTIDRLIDSIIEKKNPCIVGLDPEWELLPGCYRSAADPAEGLLAWGLDVIDAVRDIVPAVKPQMAFFEVFGAAGLRVHRQLTDHAHASGLCVIDDSKRSDIGNTARAYAFAHLAKAGPVNADFLTINPFLEPGSMQPFLDTAAKEGKGLFVLVKTSNPDSHLIAGAVTDSGDTVEEHLAAWVRENGSSMCGRHGYTSLGAVVGATHPAAATRLRQQMPRSFFLVPGFGAQGGTAEDALPCFDEQGLGAVVSSSRGILYPNAQNGSFAADREAYRAQVRARAQAMRQAVYHALKQRCPHMVY